MNLEQIEHNQWIVLCNAKKLEHKGQRKMEDHEKVMYDKLSKKFGKDSGFCPQCNNKIEGNSNSNEKPHIFVTSEGMSLGKWMWKEVHYDGEDKIHCPFDSRNEALDRAKEVMEYLEYDPVICYDGSEED